MWHREFHWLHVFRNNFVSASYSNKYIKQDYYIFYYYLFFIFKFMCCCLKTFCLGNKNILFSVHLISIILHYLLTHPGCSHRQAVFHMKVNPWYYYMGNRKCCPRKYRIIWFAQHVAEPCALKMKAREWYISRFLFPMTEMITKSNYFFHWEESIC